MITYPAGFFQVRMFGTDSGVIEARSDRICLPGFIILIYETIRVCSLENTGFPRYQC